MYWFLNSKVYTVNQESRYLLVSRIPSIGVHQELVQLFSVYGPVEEHKCLDEYPEEVAFTHVILIRFRRIQDARQAKIKLDEFAFYGGRLHVCYAPEHETIDDVREKLKNRHNTVIQKCKKYRKLLEF